MWIYMYCIWFPVMIMKCVSKAPENSLLNFHLEMNHTARYWEFTWITLISREEAVIEHSSANPKVSSSIPGPVWYRGHGLWWRIFHASYFWIGPQLPKGCECIGFLSPMHKKDPRFLFEKRRGQLREFWSLVLTIDGSTLPQDCVEEQLCWTRSNW